ncbi:MAG: glycosyltransferase family 2 protein, partial [Alphaproteobacteria bacterium]
MSAINGEAPRVCVVLVNWNGWRDTVECLESLLRSDYPNFQAVVCDNGSTDGSVEKLASWARGEAVWPGPLSPELAPLSTPPLPKPVRLEVVSPGEDPGERARATDVVVIDTRENLGFAGGNNAGIRFALAQPEVRFVWLLN